MPKNTALATNGVSKASRRSSKSMPTANRAAAIQSLYSERNREGCGSLLSGSGSFSSISENRVPGSMASARRIIAASSGCSPSTRSRALSRLMAADFTPGRPAMASSIRAAHPAQYGVALSHGFPLLAARFRSAGRANALQGNGSNRTLRARSRRLLRRAGFPRCGLHPR